MYNNTIAGEFDDKEGTDPEDAKETVNEIVSMSRCE